MLVWLDGKSNTKAKPQENFGREIMELFTVGVGRYTEADVYAAARVFTGWNLRRSEGYNRRDMNAYQEFVYNADQHDTGAKTFSFPIDRDGSRTIPERSGSAGEQDGLDLITALALHPETARRLARKFWQFFISEVHPPDPNFIARTADVYLQNGTEIRPVVRYVLTSPWFNDPSTRYARYSWPAEFVTRAVKEVGWQGLLRSTGPGRPWPIWACCCSSRRTSAGGRWDLVGSRRGQCWRGRTSPPRWPRAKSRLSRSR